MPKLKPGRNPKHRMSFRLGDQDVRNIGALVALWSSEDRAATATDVISRSLREAVEIHIGDKSMKPKKS